MERTSEWRGESEDRGKRPRRPRQQRHRKRQPTSSPMHVATSRLQTPDVKSASTPFCSSCFMPFWPLPPPWPMNIRARTSGLIDSSSLAMLATPSRSDAKMMARAMCRWGPAAARLWISSSTDDADLFLIFQVFDPEGQEVPLLPPARNTWFA